MKKTAICLCGLLSTIVLAQADTIANWTFETSAPTTAGPFSPEIGLGSASGVHTGAATYSSPAGNGSSHSFSVNTWAVNDYWQFQVSTIDFTGVGLSWDQTSSGTGPRDFRLDYSFNGTSWTTVTSYSVLSNAAPNPTWNATTSSPLYTFSPSLAGAVDNQSTVFFRLIDVSTTSSGGGTVAAGGTDRIDNFLVSGISTVPEPTTLSLFGGFALLAWSRVFRRR